jgi:hypothetical protein
MKWMYAITGAALIVLMILLIVLSGLNLFLSGWNFSHWKVKGLIQLSLGVIFGIYGQQLLKKQHKPD